MTLTDLYPQLFGKNHIQDGNVIDFAEHGRVGGVSTGQGLKYVQILNAGGSVVDSFGANVAVSLASLSVSVGDLPIAGGSLTVYQGTSPWLVTMGTLPVQASFSGSLPVAGGSLTTYQGGAPWNVLASISGSPSVLNAGGSLTAYQGSAPWSIYATVSNSLTVQSLPTLSVFGAGGSLTAYQGGAVWNVLASLSGVPSVLNAGGSLSSAQLGTWTVQPGNTPNTTAWLVTMATLPVVASFSGSIPVAGGSLTAYQGSAPWSVLATVSNVLTIQSLPTLSVLQGTSPWVISGAVTNTNLDVTLGSRLASGSTLPITGNVGQSGAWSVTATISNNVNVLNAGGSLTAYQGSSPWGMAAAGGSLTVYPGNVPNTVAWLVTMGTLTANQGLAGTQAWLVTQATLPVFASQAGTWTVQPGNTPNTVGWLVTMATTSIVGVIEHNVRNTSTMSERITNTDGTSTLFATFASLAGVKNYVTGYAAYNSSATGGYIDIRDGTAGAVLWTIPIPAGGGSNLAKDAPIFNGSAGTGLAYDVSGALSTVYLSITGFQK